MSQLQFSPIGYIQSCFKQKFAIPRQSGLAPDARGAIQIIPPFHDAEAFHGLSGCSHIWVLFAFHQKPGTTWKPRIKMPRLGGNKTLGVFASRSPNRPNPIGMSVLRLEGLRFEKDFAYLDVAGLDLLDGTPVLDIKPYLPYADRLDNASFSLAEGLPTVFPVSFSDQALTFCGDYGSSSTADLRLLLEQVLRQNPKPQYQSADSERIYATLLLDVEVRWRLTGSGQSEAVWVESITRVE